MIKKVILSQFILFGLAMYSFGQTVTLTTDKTRFKEGETITVTANLSATSSSQAVVNFAPTGTATNNSDYNFSLVGYNSLATTVAGGNGYGDRANQLGFPIGGAIDANGNLYVADFANNRIMKWAPDAIIGETVAGTGVRGSAADQLSFPYDVAIDANGNLYVADSGNHRIQKWSPGATAGETVAGRTGVSGSAADRLNTPWGVAIDAFGNLYVADSGNHRIQKWASGATTGVTVAGTGTRGSNANQLYNPYGVAVDVSGNLYVADAGNHRIQKWSPGAATGETVAGRTGVS
jgi:sugar lactone lactonase YvrE